MYICIYIARILSVMIMSTFLLTVTPTYADDTVFALRVSGSTTAIRTDGTYLVWNTPQDIAASRHALYTARLDGSTPKLLSPEVTVDAEPMLADGVVVWIERQQQNTPGSLKGYNLITNEALTISSSNAVREKAALHDRVVVWIEQDLTGNRVQVLDLATGDTGMVGKNRATQGAPAISDEWIVWVGGNGITQSIIGYNRQTQADSVSLVSVEYDVVHIVGLSNSHVVWFESTTPPPGTLPKWRLRAFNMHSDTDSVIIENTQGSSVLPSYAVEDNIVVYTPGLGGEMVSVDLQTGQRRFLITSEPALPLATDGRFVIWERLRSNQSNEIRDLLGYDLLTNQTFEIAVDEGANTFSDLADGVVVWQHNSGSVVELRATPATTFLPKTDQRYFPETGRSLDGTFLTFWEKSGGLPVFGYPLTDARIEINPDDGREYTVQYFERQRFEYHPENEGTPYAVQLGRLGSLDAEKRDLLDTEPFQSISRRSVGCRFLLRQGIRCARHFAHTGSARDLNWVTITFRMMSRWHCLVCPLAMSSLIPRRAILFSILNGHGLSFIQTTPNRTECYWVVWVRI
ncbi:MAG: hypothetical protein HC828_01100 [Blastochloris sp.]|nr:hypothetical protein [Blastochloris sp.]